MESIEQKTTHGGRVNNTTTECSLPEISDLTEITQNWKPDEGLVSLIIDYSRRYPEKEHIYVFKLNKGADHLDINDTSSTGSWLKNCLRNVKKGNDNKFVVAGSHALWVLARNLHSSFDSKWKPGDIDLFLLDQEQHSRCNLGGMDLIQTKDKTPQEVLENFDLPCCRVGFDSNYTFYASIHALAAIFSKKVYLPLYLKQRLSFVNKLKEFEENVPPEYERCHINSYYQRLVDRFVERIRKYQSRGFSFQWYETDYVLPWIKTRFHYIDFAKNIITEQQKKYIKDERERVNKLGKIKKLKLLIKHGEDVLNPDDIEELRKQLEELNVSAKSK